MTNQDFLESISLDGEEWRPIIGWESFYAVSNLGRIASFERLVVGSRRKCMRHNKPRVLSPRKSKTYNGGYYAVDLKHDGKTRKMYVHRLVAIHFIPNEDPSKNEVDHINRNTLDNRVQNLRWVSHSENLNNPNTIRKQRESMKGNHNAPRKSVVRIIGSEIKIYKSMAEAQIDGYHKAAIFRCCRGLQQEHKGAKWLYLSDYETSNQ